MAGPCAFVMRDSERAITLVLRAMLRACPSLACWRETVKRTAPGHGDLSAFGASLTPALVPTPPLPLPHTVLCCLPSQGEASAK